MVESIFQVLRAPARVKAAEERPRCCKVAADVDWRRRRREVRLAQIRRHVLEVTVSVGRAIEPRVGEMRRIAAVLAARGGGIARPGEKGENANVLILRRIESLPASRGVVHRVVQTIHRAKLHAQPLSPADILIARALAETTPLSGEVSPGSFLR